jgi:uncharacterized protein YbjT (DUF2867 family)
MLTKQEIFDKAVNGIRAQGRPSMGAADRCFSRSADGYKCAVGHLIPDALYTPEMEGHGIALAWARQPPVIGGPAKLREALKRADVNVDEPDTLGLLADLQTCHDFSARRYGSQEFMHAFEENVRKMAQIYGLIYNPPKE